ncbi:uncharacterized protein IL334_003079 [Kwoniella shivajii]|uniref:BAR domain-containing protein n=1 Tax=Kwoniella shivajii TaxID=564305 RepID=A0ABZ1CZJ2_9TREE|nr:hypothetical protein IL334_003079 [Kwoniella shivajii]
MSTTDLGEQYEKLTTPEEALKYLEKTFKDLAAPTELSSSCYQNGVGGKQITDEELESLKKMDTEIDTLAHAFEHYAERFHDLIGQYQQDRDKDKSRVRTMRSQLLAAEEERPNQLSNKALNRPRNISKDLDKWHKMSLTSDSMSDREKAYDDGIAKAIRYRERYDECTRIVSFFSSDYQLAGTLDKTLKQWLSDEDLVRTWERMHPPPWIPEESEVSPDSTQAGEEEVTHITGSGSADQQTQIEQAI